MDKHTHYMSTALRLSMQTYGTTSPNPTVGAVIVKNDRIIAAGIHKKAGARHAEVIALKRAGTRARNATLYVTLEPCSTFSRTPPCTEAIIRSGIKKVVVGLRDPNPLHQGRGIALLKKHKINVQYGILEKAIRDTLQPYIKYITTQYPYVSVKIAQSIDGKIATESGDSKWITSIAARRHAHRLRNHYDAIMVGITTVLVDNPLLNPTHISADKKFSKVVVDTSLRMQTTLRIFKDIHRYPVIIAASKQSIRNNAKKIQLLIKKGATIVGVSKKGRLLDVDDLLRKLAYLEIATIVVEGGGHLIGSLFDENHIDYIRFFIRPAIIGGADAIASIQGKGIRRIIDMKPLYNMQLRRLGSDVLIEGALQGY